LQYEKSNLIHIQTKDNLVILTHKIDTLIFLKNVKEKNKKNLHTKNGYNVTGMITNFIILTK